MRERGSKFSGDGGFYFGAIVLILSVAFIVTKTDEEIRQPLISTHATGGKVTEFSQTVSGVVTQVKSERSGDWVAGRRESCSITLNTKERQVTISAPFTECQKVSEGDGIVLEREKHLHLIEGYKHDSWKPWKVASPLN